MSASSSPSPLTSATKSAITPLLDRRKLRYLDVGCGGGIFAESVARLPSTASVTGIDASTRVLAVARTHARRDPSLVESRGRLSYQHASIEALPAPQRPEDGYDVVSMFEVIEHVPSPSDFLAAATAHVRPGGWLVLSTIARTWTSWAVTKVLAEEVARVVPRGTHEWSRYVNAGELKEWFTTKGGWEEPRVMGLVYVPGFGWKEVSGGEAWGNYFFGIRKAA